MSASPSEARLRSLSRRMRIASIWLETVATLPSCSRPDNGNPTSTTMSTSTPMSRATCTGRLSAMPPSTSSRPSRSTGVKMPGAERLARSALTRSPRPSTTASPVSRSVATARKRVGRRSKSSMRPTGSVSLRSIWVSFWPCMRPLGSWNRPSRSPSGRRTRNSRSSRLRRKFRSSRRGRSRKASSQSRLANSRSISAPVMPLAYRPPTTAPMLVPAIASTGMRSSSSTLSTPTCAAPSRPAPRQHQADARPHRVFGLLCLHGCHRCKAQQGAGENKDESRSHR